ncbi:hypothetical protein WK80_08050 [Burkholderia multivorans]|nr:hypothetical protein WM33_09745 [Burkholderia multivorans]KVV32156.1 hypothetical protein WK80_08050 [Burkholderia multivorans]KVZ78200.1 hypothetical protein WL23_19185 [Burkholderia multivorans]OXH88958.1 hypothetical protein CA831_15660 [Burkholderia multivorans]OXH93087.1 hypothetical protein CA830_09780 [Burkholderia multivorans]
MSARAACGTTACRALRPSVAHVDVDARVATIVALATGFVTRMLAVRFGGEMRTFGAADVEH